MDHGARKKLGRRCVSGKVNVQNLNPSAGTEGSSRGLDIMGYQHRKWETDYYGRCVGGGQVSVVVWGG